MTDQEAIKYLKDANRNNQMVGILPKSDIGKCLIKALEEIQQYRAIGTPEECRAAVEKRKSKKPNKCIGFTESLFVCPTCGRKQPIMYEQHYCKECGQKLDWSDEEC